MSLVPEILLGVLALLILLGLFAGTTTTPRNIRADVRLGASQAAGANPVERQRKNNPAGNTGQIMSMPGISSDSDIQSKDS